MKGIVHVQEAVMVLHHRSSDLVSMEEPLEEAVTDLFSCKFRDLIDKTRAMAEWLTNTQITSPRTFVASQGPLESKQQTQNCLGSFD